MPCAKDRACKAAAFVLVLGVLLQSWPVLGASYQPIENTAAKREPPAQAAQKAGSQPKSRRAIPAPKGQPPPAPKEQPAAENQPAPAGSHSGFRLFGTVGFKRPVEAAPAWFDAMRRNSENPVFQPGKYFTKQVNWQTLKSELEKLDTLAQLNKVNAFWNRFPYITDAVNWGQADYWAAPAQFLKKSGDCEDYAIVKYFTLRELGYPAEMMRIVAVYDTIRREGHAVLAVKANDNIYILDNLGRAVQSQDRIRNYEPQFSVNELGRWNQMRPKK